MTTRASIPAVTRTDSALAFVVANLNWALLITRSEAKNSVIYDGKRLSYVAGNAPNLGANNLYNTKERYGYPYSR